MELVIHMYVIPVVLLIKLGLFVIQVNKILKSIENFIWILFVFIGVIPTPSEFHIIMNLFFFVAMFILLFD
jgi:hypothetical protein